MTHPVTLASRRPPLCGPRGLDGGRLRIALAGCGTVGSAFAALIQERANHPATHGHTRLELVRALVRDPARARPAGLKPDLVTTSADEFLGTECDVVVEAAGNLQLTRRLARETLAAGRHYVTANKALVADCGPELAQIAEYRGGRFDFGAAVAGGVPVVRLLREQAGSTEIRQIGGILNGTTNFLLGRISEGLSLQAALAEAQSLGYAEPDPRRDVSGQDAADKIAILAWLAFGCHPRQLAVRRNGLGAIAGELGAVASAVGGVPKLLAEAVLTQGGVIGRVDPVIVPAGSGLASVRGVENLLAIESPTGQRIELRGAGAGGLPAAGALLADVLRPAAPLRQPTTSYSSAAEDPREHDWLVLVSRERRSAVHQACLTLGIKYQELLVTTRPRARSLGTVRCTAGTLDRLVSRHDTGLYQAMWVRWERSEGMA